MVIKSTRNIQLMINEFDEKLAKLAVNYSVEVKKGQRVLIIGPMLAEKLFQALYVEVLKTGGHPLLFPQIEGRQELLYKYGSEDQLFYYDQVLKKIDEEFDCFVLIYGDYNPKKLSLVDSKLIAKVKGSPANKESSEVIRKRAASGEMKWVVVPYPCHSFAQEANMDLFSYTDFVRKALFLDKEDPVREWKELKKNQEYLIKYLITVDNIRILGEDTDLMLSVKGRNWFNACGQVNLPDGEVATGPLENSVNGHIRFSNPGIYLGKEIENIYLEFKDGKVSKAKADKGERLLQEILAIENANIIGEFAVGTNHGITDFTKNMAFDEKIGGTIHCALGAGFPETGSMNYSAIHWDILKDMRLPGSKIIADGIVIYEEGRWKI
jgi:aminopeptidase